MRKLLQLILALKRRKLWLQHAAFSLPHHFSMYFSWLFCRVHRLGNKSSSMHYFFQAKQNHDCHYSKPVNGNKIWKMFFAWLVWWARLTSNLKISIQHISEKKRLEKMQKKNYICTQRPSSCFYWYIKRNRCDVRSVSQDSNPRLQE